MVTTVKLRYCEFDNREWEIHLSNGSEINVETSETLPYIRDELAKTGFRSISFSDPRSVTGIAIYCQPDNWIILTAESLEVAIPDVAKELCEVWLACVNALIEKEKKPKRAKAKKVPL